MPAPSTWIFDGIGTRWQIDSDVPVSQELRAELLRLVESFDLAFSRFRADSTVSFIARAERGGRFTFPAYANGLFDLYDWLFDATDGAVDPLVGRALELLGYDAAYSLTPADARSRDEHQTTRARWDAGIVRRGETVTTTEPIVIDVGAAGKGLLVDLLTQRLLDENVRPVVDASGDLVVASSSGVDVGLEHPLDPQRAVGVVHVAGRALCASSITRRAWGDGLHHVVDARTGVPATSTLATWTLAETAMVADGLATALFFTDPERLTAQFRFDWVRMSATGRLEHSPDFPGELFA